MGQRIQYDWASIATDYIQGSIDPETGKRVWPTYAELAEKYGGSANTIGGRAVREKWREQQQRFINDSIHRAYDEGVDARAKELVEMDRKHHSLAENLLIFVDQWIRSHVQKDAQGRPIKVEADPDSLSKITSVVQRIQSIQRTALGLPATNPPNLTRHKIEVEGDVKVQTNLSEQILLLVSQMTPDDYEEFTQKLNEAIAAGTLTPGS